MNNKAEMRAIFKKLSFKNQADLLIRARQSYFTQKENKHENEEMLVFNGNTNRYVGVTFEANEQRKTW